MTKVNLSIENNGVEMCNDNLPGKELPLSMSETTSVENNGLVDKISSDSSFYLVVSDASSGPSFQQPDVVTDHANIIIEESCDPLRLENHCKTVTDLGENVSSPSKSKNKSSNDEYSDSNLIQNTNDKVSCDVKQVSKTVTGNCREEDPSVVDTEREDPAALDGGEEAFNDDMSNKVKIVLNLDGIKDSGGLLYIGCKNETEKTNPLKIVEWFPSEFLSVHGVYAIKEEEPFLLRIFTRNHESTNRNIRRKGGRKVMLMEQEVFGDVFLACGHCGYWSYEGSNVRRHLKRSACLKERGYTKEDLIGLDRNERRKFLRRLAAAKCRAKKKAKVTALEATECDGLEGNTMNNGFLASSLPVGLASNSYNECLVEIQENSSRTIINGSGPHPPSRAPNITFENRFSHGKAKKKPRKYKALTLGPDIVQDIVQRVSFDIYTINENNDRVAWKPPSCHKASPGDKHCQIVFKGARMRRRCLDLPIPMVLIYRKLDCKLHHCNFTLFHPNVRSAIKNDDSAKASVNVKIYGDIVMTHEFYHYFVSLLSIMKMKSSQTARHLTSVWETIIADRIGSSSIPDEHRKVITLSKQTVKSIWSSIEDESGNKGDARLVKGPRKKKKPPPPSVIPTIPPPNLSGVNHQTPIAAGACSMPPVHIPQAGMQQHQCMKRINPMPPKPPPPPKPHIMGPPPPPPLPQNHMQQPTHAPVNHPHWLSQGPQYPHNVAPYPMAPPPPPTPEYYPMPGHFMAQYAPTTMGTSP